MPTGHEGLDENKLVATQNFHPEISGFHDPIFDEHISIYIFFQMGWLKTHQLYSILPRTCECSPFF